MLAVLRKHASFPTCTKVRESASNHPRITRPLLAARQRICTLPYLQVAAGPLQAKQTYSHKMLVLLLAVPSHRNAMQRSAIGHASVKAMSIHFSTSAFNSHLELKPRVRPQILGMLRQHPDYGHEQQRNEC